MVLYVTQKHYSTISSLVAGLF